jgi:hypothetical protein
MTAQLSLLHQASFSALGRERSLLVTAKPSLAKPATAKRSEAGLTRSRHTGQELRPGKPLSFSAMGFDFPVEMAYF